MKMTRLPEDFYPLLRRMLRIPEEPLNMLDIASRSFRTGHGEPLLRLTANDEHILRYMVGDEVTEEKRYERVVSGHTIISTQAKITLASFPLAFVSPEVSEYVYDEYRLTDTHIRLPDFESRAKRQLLLKNTENLDIDDTIGIDLGIEESAEEKEARIKLEAEELEKEIAKLARAEKKRINEHDLETSLQRLELSYLQQTYKLLAPEGILLFLTNRQLMDKPFLHYLYTSFERVVFHNIPDDENNRILITGTRRQRKAEYDATVVNQWLQHRYGTNDEPMPDLGLSNTVYHVPAVPVEQLFQFRIGPITEKEVLALHEKSSLVSRIIGEEMRLPVYEPVAPAPLHKGHLVQLLTSGMIDSYIGEGSQQHLVKGSSVRMANTVVENMSEEETTTIRDYYTVNLKLLLPDGSFLRIN
ncbi:hypothetical protein C0431_12695 [bacterium]|nr:hypothetical protein [bacterium]